MDNHLKQQIGVVIAHERMNRAYSQRQFAEILGITQSYVHQIETGKKMPSLSLLIKFSQIFEFDFSHLFNANSASKN